MLLSNLGTRVQIDIQLFNWIMYNSRRNKKVIHLINLNSYAEDKMMTNEEYKDVIVEFLVAAGVSAIAFYTFVILAFIFDKY